MREQGVKRIAWTAAFAVAATMGCSGSAQDEPGFRDTPMLPDGKWRVHDADRPHPETVTAGDVPGAPPSDAIVLFDGTSLDAWQPQATPWIVRDGAVVSTPRFGPDGKLLRPAYITAFLNGVLVQNRQPWLGPTVWRQVGKYEPHGDAAPIQLQDHNSPVSFRNIWVRRLPEGAASHDFEGEVK